MNWLRFGNEMTPEKAFWEGDAIVLFPFSGDGDYSIAMLAGGLSSQRGAVVFFRDDWDAPMQSAHPLHLLPGQPEEAGQAWQFEDGRLLIRIRPGLPEFNRYHDALDALHAHIKERGYTQETYDRIAQDFWGRGA